MTLETSFKWISLFSYFAVVLCRNYEKIPSIDDALEIEVVTPPIYLGEGPHWDNETQSLYFVDLLGQNFYRLDYTTGNLYSVHLTHGPIGVVIPIQNQRNRFLVACGLDILLVNWNGRTNVTNPPFTILKSLDKFNLNTRVNDGKCDSLGRFWIGTMAYETPNGDIPKRQGALYSLDSKLKKWLTQLTISNGLAWNSRNDIMYFADSGDFNVRSFDYDLQTGKISNSRIVFNLTKSRYNGIIDGMTMDTDDNLWLVNHDGFSILQVDPRTSKVLRSIALPARRLTSVAFGGPKLDVLFVTSAFHRVFGEEKAVLPYSGATFAIKGLGVKGRLANKFILRTKKSKCKTGFGN